MHIFGKDGPLRMHDDDSPRLPGEVRDAMACGHGPADELQAGASGKPEYGQLHHSARAHVTVREPGPVTEPGDASWHASSGGLPQGGSQASCTASSASAAEPSIL